MVRRGSGVDDGGVGEAGGVRAGRAGPVWTAGRVSDSPESGLSGCLSYCSVLLLNLVGRPVPQGGVESFLIVCSSSIQEAISRMALLLVGYTI